VPVERVAEFVDKPLAKILEAVPFESMTT